MTTCGRCNTVITFPDYRHGRLGLCRACTDADYEKAERARSQAVHPAGTAKRLRRKTWTEWWLEARPFSPERWRPVK